jgi:c-di-AMP phosphodiesterase-like protein
MSEDNQQKDEFLEAGKQKDSNLVAELIGFMNENKKWWLSPIIAVLLLIGLLIFLGGSGIAPFIYTLF